MGLLPLLLVTLGLSTAVGAADAIRQVVADWPRLPEGKAFGVCSGVGVDSQNRVYVFHRNERVWKTPFSADPIEGPTVSVIDGTTGALLGEWGAGAFVMPHGLTVDSEGHVWLTDVGLHQVFKFTHDGQLLLTLGTRGVPGDDAAHFNLPTDVAVLTDGSFYVSDGYKNTRVVKFGATGQYQREWGGKGSKPGEFILPHGIAVASNARVYVCDRTNSRVQVFDAEGRFLNQWKGPHIGRPYGIEASHDGGIFIIDGGEPSLRKTDRGKAVELDTEGRVINTFGSYGSQAGQFILGHDIAVGPDGAVYVADATGQRVQKFIKRTAPTE